ncbi:MAG: CDP-alcohol phosphatidyltransferase family protein [Planctomycetota bacterium]|nr:CDP-alcohol phosphatidyltransferase family protein [Planctomycetota bacterium]
MTEPANAPAETKPEPTTLPTKPTFGKPPQVEELVDYYLNRRVAAQVVKLLIHTPLTPNQVSIISMLFSVAAAGCLFACDPHLAALAGGLLYIGIVLDCADGQLARARGGGSLGGRIVDGVCDYISGIALFIGAAWFASVHAPAWTPVPVWALALVAALSTVLHCAMQDGRKNAFLARFVPSFHEGAEPGEVVLKELETARQKKQRLDAAMLRLYLVYLRLQGGLHRPKPTSEPTAAPGWEFKPPARWDLCLIRFWSFLGFTTHLFLLVLACLASPALPYAVFWYLATIAVIANVWMVILLATAGRGRETVSRS